MAGADVAYTYLYVFSPEVDSPAEMSGLVYPNIPLPATSTAAAVTATSQSAANTTFDASFATTPEPEANTWTSMLRYVILPTAEPEAKTFPTDDAGTPPTSTTLPGHVVERADVTSSWDWMTSREAVDDVVVVVVVGGVVGACLLVGVVLGVACLIVRRRRHTGKYDPSRPHAADQPCCRGFCPCVPSTPGAPDDPAELDTSTATLRPLNASPGSSAFSSADRGSLVSEVRPNGVTTCRRTDPVQRTLIGGPPPLTNLDAPS